MDKQRKKNDVSREYSDDEIRNLVLMRLEAMSSDTIKVVGDRGAFSRDQLIEHVKSGDEIGLKIQQIEMNWLRAQKGGFIDEILNE